MRFRSVHLAALLAVAAPAVHADVKLNPLFTSGAVLQRGMPVPVWGTGSEGEEVTVRFQGQSHKVFVEQGKWRVNLRPLSAGGPYSLLVMGKNKLLIDDMLVGEVWICSGQSNMQWSVSASSNPVATIAGATDEGLRLFTVPRQATDDPISEVKASWQRCTPSTIPDFSAVAYFFGRDLRKALGVPVGLINTSYGGTPAEAWTRRDWLMNDSLLAPYVRNYDANVSSYIPRLMAHRDAMQRFNFQAELRRKDGRPVGNPPGMPGNPAASAQRPCGLYNAMIAPLLPYAIKGAIWYQGESNAGQAHLYRTLFPSMIANWRHDWGQGDFPFLFVQLAPFQAIVSEPQDSAWAELREAQLMTSLNLKNTAQAVITDYGDPVDIHPKQKEPVGARLALAARYVAYDERVQYKGPEFHSMVVRDGAARLRFTSIGGGLTAVGGKLTGFTIAGSDRKFYNAEAEIEGNMVIVKSPMVANPAAVRFGWANSPVVNFFNQAGLPASPFRTDAWPGVTQPK